MRFEIEGMRSGYAEIGKAVLAHGDEVSPRGQRTKELIDVVIKINDPTDSIPIGTGRKVNQDVSWVEGLQLISGASYPQLTCKIAPNMASFMDGEVFHGAYGLRTRGQYGVAIERLKKDPSTRQAVATIWDPQQDAFAGDSFKDFPCTVMQTFFIRNGKLSMHTTMRSNDFWWGLGNDVGQFTLLQVAIANALDIEPGPYYHHAVSFHAYERDWEKIEDLTVNDDTTLTPWSGGIGEDLEWNEIVALAKAMLDGNADDYTPSEIYIAERMRRYQ